MLYGCEIWRHESFEQIEIFHRTFLRRILQVRKSVPKALIYGEIGQKEFKYGIWKRMSCPPCGKSLFDGKLVISLFLRTRLNYHETRWFLGVKSILIYCVDKYISIICDAEFTRLITRQM